MGCDAVKTFREILAEAMNAESPAPSQTRPAEPTPRLWLDMTMLAQPSIAKPRPSRHYSRGGGPKMRPLSDTQQKTTPDKVSEVVTLNLADLSLSETVAWHTLRAWFKNLPETLDESRLRQVYRQLARQFHPDAQIGSQSESLDMRQNFTDVRQAVQILRAALKRKAQVMAAPNDSACDSESASEPGRQSQGAA